MNDLNQQLTKLIHELIPEAAGLDECSNCYGLLSIGADPMRDCEDCTFKSPELRHVLWALEAWLNEDGEDEQHEFKVSSDGFLGMYFDGLPINMIAWNLQFNLYGQTKELKEFILNLLTQSK